MLKTITYTSFAIATLLVVLAFVTAKSYAQLAIAVVLYPALAYFALKIFRRRTRGHGAAFEAPVIALPTIPKHKEPAREKVDIVDLDKRTFLKLIGATGISVFIFSLLGRRVASLLPGMAEDQIGAPQAESSPTSGYRITEVDESGPVAYYGFVAKDGAWMIMRDDTEANSFRYAKGDLGFEQSWARRANLKYDYYHDLF